MFSCTAQLFLRFLPLGFRNLPLYPGPEKRSLLPKRSRKPSFSPCAASTQPRTKPEDFLPPSRRRTGSPRLPEKRTTIFRRSKKPAVRHAPPQELREQATFKHAESPFPGRSSRLIQESRTAARRLIRPRHMLRLSQKQHPCSCRFPDDAQGSGKADACPASFSEHSRSLPFFAFPFFKETAASRSTQRLSEKFLSRQTPRRTLPPCPTARISRKSARRKLRPLFRHAETGRLLSSPLQDVSSPKICPASPPPSEIRHSLKTAKGMPLSGHPFRLFLSA